MKANLRHSMLPVIVGCTVTLATGNVFGLGADYPNDRIVNQPSWPQGMKDLVNATNRIGGLFVNAEDVFFFAGSVSNFNAFLGEYAKVHPIEKHRLILHAGVGEAYSLGGGNKRPCDWKLDGCPKGWLNLGKMSSQGTSSIEAMREAAKDTNYVLEVHFWTGGKISLDRVLVPQNVEFAGDCLKIFESITNGMTRAEVGKRVVMDGGLQGGSPVRFTDPGCPGFKINVEFDFKKDAADQGRAISVKDDKVIRVSKPYLESPFTD